MAEENVFVCPGCGHEGRYCYPDVTGIRTHEVACGHCGFYLGCDD